MRESVRKKSKEEEGEGMMENTVERKGDRMEGKKEGLEERRD